MKKFMSFSATSYFLNLRVARLTTNKPLKIADSFCETLQTSHLTLANIFQHHLVFKIFYPIFQNTKPLCRGVFRT